MPLTTAHDSRIHIPRAHFIELAASASSWREIEWNSHLARDQWIVTVQNFMLVVDRDYPSSPGEEG